MASNRTICMHDSYDHPMKMIIGFNFGQYRELPTEIKEQVLDALDMSDCLEIPGVPDGVIEGLSETCHKFVGLCDCLALEQTERDVMKKYFTKFVPAVIYDNANEEIWIGIDLGYLLCKKPAERRAYEKSGAIDAKKLIEMAMLFKDYWKGTTLAKYGSPSIATLWCQ